MRFNYKKGLLIGLLSGAMALCMVGCGSVRMTTGDAAEGSAKKPKATSPQLLLDSDVVGKNTNKDLEEIQGYIDKYFYFDTDEQALQDGIIRGYMEGLDDPYSVYYTAEEYADFLQATDGEFVGVGVQVSQNKETLAITVLRVLEGPAKEAGIEKDDVIVKVDGVDITEEDVDAVVEKIRGVEGTEVTLTVYRASDKENHDFTMKRRKVENPTVDSKMLDHNIGYVSVSSFYEVTGSQYIDAVEQLKSEGMEGLIVDVRSNGGGLLDIAVDMLDYMLPAGKLVYTKDKDGNVTSEYNSTDEQQFTLPLVVLVDGYSASASEIFAGAIKDYGTGTLVGTNTYGKGIVQRLYELKDGSAIKLTIAKYFTPNGNDIHKVGIKPDVEVELDANAYRESKGEKDNQLDKAVEVLMEKMGKSVDKVETDESASSEE